MEKSGLSALRLNNCVIIPKCNSICYWLTTTNVLNLNLWMGLLHEATLTFDALLFEAIRLNQFISKDVC